MNRKADFLQNESILIDSHNESNQFDSNRELECSNASAILAMRTATVNWTCTSSLASTLKSKRCIYQLGFFRLIHRVNDVAESVAIRYDRHFVGITWHNVWNKRRSFIVLFK